MSNSRRMHARESTPLYPSVHGCLTFLARVVIIVPEVWEGLEGLPCIWWDRYCQSYDWAGWGRGNGRGRNLGGGVGGGGEWRARQIAVSGCDGLSERYLCPVLLILNEIDQTVKWNELSALKQFHSRQLHLRTVQLPIQQLDGRIQNAVQLPIQQLDGRIQNAVQLPIPQLDGRIQNAVQLPIPQLDGRIQNARASNNAQPQNFKNKPSV